MKAGPVVGAAGRGRRVGAPVWACAALVIAAAGSASSAETTLSARRAPERPTPEMRTPAPLYEGELIEGPSARALHLRAATVPAFKERRDFAARLGTIRETSRRWVIQLDGPLTKPRLKRLAEAGIVVGEYLPTNAFVVRVDKADLGAAEGIDFVRWHGAYETSWKIAPEIGEFERPGSLAKAGEREVIVTLFKGEPLERLLGALGAFPEAAVFTASVSGGNVTADMVVSEANLTRLAALDCVSFIEPALEATSRNDTSSWVVQSNVTGYEPLHEAGLRGEGQVLGHMDGRLNVNHCSLSDTDPIGPLHRKILAFNATAGTADTHGSHTAGTAVGDDPGSTGDLDGIAPGARLAHHLTPAFTEMSFKDRLQLHHDQGARVHTNSWGNDGSTSYNAWARAVDVFSHDNEDSLVCFAVTNLATLKTPENAKNCLAVGACRDGASSQQFCSGGVGNTADGRRKPEVFAPGCSILSANTSACGVSSLTGTSMACPAVSGAGLLVRQYFTDGFYPGGQANPSDALTPTGALIKAVLINSAQNMTSYGAGYPNASEGWGRIQADEALWFDRDPVDTRRLIVKDVRNTAPEAMDTGETDTTLFRVLDGTEDLRVTMAFTDKEGDVNDATPVVNNLNLLVTSPSAVSYRGNVFNASGVSTTGGSNDAINNVEQVHVSSPEAGVWTVEVIANAVNSPMDDQGFALVITGAVTTTLTCEGDVNGDFALDTADLGIMLDVFGSSDESADLNDDGVVDTADLGTLLGLLDQGCQ